MKYKGFVLLLIFVVIGCTGAPEPATTQTPTVTTIPPTITPLPFIEGTEFPTGKFESEREGIEFREDGTCFWYSLRDDRTVPCRYGVSGNLYSEMTFSGSGRSEVPATYYWYFDGEELFFQLWGKDLWGGRKAFYVGQTLLFVSESDSSTKAEVSEFPIGRFVHEDGSRAREFDKDGNWRYYEGDLEVPQISGKYAVSGEFYTEMTHDYSGSPLVPATYYWTYDGKNLSFKLWGEDVNSHRKSAYDGQTYIFIEGSDTVKDE